MGRVEIFEQKTSKGKRVRSLRLWVGEEGEERMIGEFPMAEMPGVRRHPEDRVKRWKKGSFLNQQQAVDEDYTTEMGIA